MKLQQEREARVLEEMATISKGPVITQKAAAVKGDFIARQEEWAARVKREKEETRQRQEEARARTGDEGRRVAMSKRSEQLARRRGAPQGPVKEWDARFEKHCRAKTMQPAADTFQPRITAAAARLRNRGTAAERLHNDAVQRVSRHEARVIEQTERDMYDPQTGRPRYTPQAAGGGRDGGGAGDASVCSRSNPPSPPGQMRGTILFTKAPRRDESVKENSQDSVVHRLLAHGQAAELKRNRRQNATEQEVQAGAHGTKLSKYVGEQSCCVVPALCVFFHMQHTQDDAKSCRAHGRASSAVRDCAAPWGRRGAARIRLVQQVWAWCRLCFRFDCCRLRH